MTRSAAGRPPKPTKVDPVMMDAARTGLAAAGRRLVAAPKRRRHQVGVDPALVDCVLAVRLAEALELLAAEGVTRARADFGLTWTDVGAAFDTSAQSAHTRFRRR